MCLEIPKLTYKNHQFVMVDPVERFQFKVSRLCFECFVRFGTLLVLFAADRQSWQVNERLREFSSKFAPQI